MKTQGVGRITPLENPHSKSAKHEGKSGKKASVLDEVLDQIKERTKHEMEENKKPKVLRKKDPMRTTAEAQPQPRNPEEGMAEAPSATKVRRLPHN
jgi:hypothetical protein